MRRDSSRQMRLPTHHSCTSEEGTPGPLDVLDATLGAPAPTYSASAASLVDAELSVYLQADVISRVEPPTEWWAANAAKQATRCWLQKPSAISATVKIGSESEIGNKLT